MIIRELSIAEIKKTYREHLKADFPADELKPLAMILRSYRQGNYLCLGAFDGEDIAGYAYFVFHGRICLLDYFAVVRGRRGQGIGSEFLKQFKMPELCSRCDYLLIEVEDPFQSDAPDTATRLKRLDFYLRGGAVNTGVHARVFGVDYALLEYPLTGAAHTGEEATDAYGKLYGSLLPGLLFKSQIFIRT